jgi:hypothetical protein
LPQSVVEIFSARYVSHQLKAAPSWTYFVTFAYFAVKALIAEIAKKSHKARKAIRVQSCVRPDWHYSFCSAHWNAHCLLGSVFQKSMPAACGPTSIVATVFIAAKSMTSTVPGSVPIPSTEMNA